MTGSQKVFMKTVVVANIYNLSIWEDGSTGSEVQDQPEMYHKILLPKENYGQLFYACLLI